MERYSMTVEQNIEPHVSSTYVINVDYTHVARRASGIERIAIEQFSSKMLSPLDVRPYQASRGNRLSVLLAQMVGLPLHASKHSAEVYIFPGFPPSPYFAYCHRHSVLFVHDLFLLTRRNDLNTVGKYYMAPMFDIAIRRFRHFLANSVTTARELQAYRKTSAEIVVFRPYVRNVFRLSEQDRSTRPTDPKKIRLVSVGTIEPRKNFGAAAQICDALARRLGREVELHIVGRFGWGPDVDELRNRPHVILHGYVDDPTAREIISACDFLLCTSHAEGLCLPLIEVQYSGMPVIAPDKEIFREVLGASGILLKPAPPDQLANQIVDVIAMPSWRATYVAASKANIVRWNTIAEMDRATVVSFLSSLASQPPANSV